MKLTRKALTAAAALALACGISAAAGTAAHASSTGCAFSNGCATLHGTDAASHQVAMDAKRQSSKPGTLVIGYPDLTGDGATSFDAVLHYTSGHGAKAWDDTGLTQWSSDETDVTATVTPTPTASTSDPALSVFIGAYNAVTGCLGLTVEGGTPFEPVPPSTTPVPGYTVSLAGLPGAVVTTGPASGTPASAAGTICVGGDTLAPGVYHSLVLTASDAYKFGNPLAADPESASVAFAAQVHGIQVTTPATAEPYYTFVYAAKGVWSSECVTDTNGSGALTLQLCTLGKDLGQDFFALSGGAPVTLGGGTYAIQNRFALIGSAADSCLTDPSSLLPSTPQTDAADEASSPAGRQLRTDGSCTTAADLWSWAS